jgi:DNA-binding transcriptional LysR family regulator
MPHDLIRRGLKIAHLRLFAELSSKNRLSEAADAIRIAQPAASRLIAEAENLAGTKLYVRSGRGIELTPAGQQLAYRSIRILQEISDAGRDIEHHISGQSGHVSIGSVTGPAIEYILPAIRHIRLSYPDISISVEVAPSRVLAPMLQKGRLDFSLSRVPVDQDPALFEEKPLLGEPAVMIGRVGHPLTRTRAPLSIDSFLGFDWVLPPVGSPIRTNVEQALRDRRLPLPARVLTTSSFLFTLATIQQTNAVAPVAKSVADSFAARPDGTGATLTVLDSNLTLSVETYSFLTRKGQVLTPVAQVVAREVLRAVTGDTNLP